MAYADGDSLRARIRLAIGANPDSDPFGWTWTDVTADWHIPDDVQHRWGRSPGAQGPETSTLSLALKNTGAKYTNLAQWTPIAFDVDLGDGGGWRQRFGGYVRRLTLDWPGSALVSHARIEAVGELGRIGRGTTPAYSPTRRSLAASGSGLLAYWPLEDGETATAGASALPGGTPMLPAGTVKWAAFDPTTAGSYYRGSLPLPDLTASGGSLTGSVPSGSSSPTAWAVQVFHRAQMSNTDTLSMIEWTTRGGTHGRWRYGFRLDGTPGTFVQAHNGSTWSTVWSETLLNNGPANLAVCARQNGSNIQVWFKHSSFVAGPVSIPGTLGRVTSVTLNPNRTTGLAWITGHVRVWDRHDEPNTGAATRYLGAYNGDDTLARLARLATEDRVRLHIDPPAPRALEYMGHQPMRPALDLYQDVEATDGGLLYERGHSLGYLPRVNRYNPPVVLTVDAAAGQLGGGVSLTGDDQDLRTQVTASREGGSAVTVGNPDAVARHGVLEQSISPNVYWDGQLEGMAAWELHLSSVAEKRVSALPISLHSSPELAAQWLQCGEGSRIRVINPPPQSGLAEMDQIITGASEVFGGRRRWVVTLTTQPAAPWLVAVGGGGQRIGARGTRTDEPLTLDGLSVWIVNTPANGGWTTAAAHFPLDVMVGQEHVRVSSIVGTGLGQRLIISARGLNGIRSAWPTGTPVDVLRPAIAAL